MRDLPRHQPPHRPAWLLATLWILGAVAILVAAVWSLADNPVTPPGEPYCITYLECPVDQTP